MNKRTLPLLPVADQRAGCDFEVSPRALQRWNVGLKAQAQANGAATEIAIYGYIGDDGWGGGVTAAFVQSRLREAGTGDVVVNINSPGGSFFEGVAIYNLLRGHAGQVTVRVIGMAASAASIIAMAGDRVEMGRAAFLMIHNVLMLVIGNRNDLRAAADTIEPMDRAMADLYAARCGQSREAVAALLDAETWLGGSDAVEQGFADALLDEAAIEEEPDPANAAAATARARSEIQAALSRAGYSRGRQRELLKNFGGMPGAAPPAARSAMPSAGPVTPASPTASGSPSSQPHTQSHGDIMDLKALETAHPQLVADLRATALADGAAQERARIQSVEAQTLPGHGDLIARLKYDGKTTGPEAAAQVLAAERSKLGKRVEDILADAQAVSGVKPAPAADPGAPKPSAAADDDKRPLEDRSKAKWDATPALRAEYAENFKAYLAFERAQAAGRVRVLGRQAA